MDQAAEGLPLKQEATGETGVRHGDEISEGTCFYNRLKRKRTRISR